MLHMLSFNVILGLAAVLSASGAEEDPSARPPTHQFGTRIEIVRVDVGVVDPEGYPVRDLKTEDFVLEENEIPQKIESLESIALSQNVPGRLWSGDRVSSNTEPPPHMGRTFVIVFDDIHLGPDGAKRAQAAILDFVERLPENDQTNVVSTSGQIWCTGAASRHNEAVVAALQRLKGLRIQDPLATDQMTEYEAMQIAQYEDAVALKNVEDRLQRELDRVARGGPPDLFSAERGSSDQPFGSMDEQGSPLISGGQAIPSGESFAAAALSRSMQTRARHEIMTARSLATHLHTRTKQRRARALQSLQRLLLALAGTEARKTLILLTEHFIYDPTDPQFAALSDAARRANAAIHVLDVGGLVDSARQGAQQKTGDRNVSFDEQAALRLGLARIASDGGGFAITSSNDLAGALKRIARESMHYYLLAYQPTNEVFDQEFRRIRVSVSRPGVLVRARPGYYAVQGGSSADTGAADEESMRRLRRALDAPVSFPDIPLRMSSYAFEQSREGKTRTLLVSEMRIDDLAFEEKDGQLIADVDLLLGVKHFASGATFGEQPVVARLTARSDVMGKNIWHRISREISLPAGPCQARLVVRDRKSGLVGSVIHMLDVPDNKKWRTSSPVLSDIVRSSEDGDERHATPIARRRFATAGTLYCEFEVYGSVLDKTTGLPRVSRTLSLVGEGGKTKYQIEPTPIVPTIDRELAQFVAIPLRGLEPGNYELILELKDEVFGRTLELREPFSLARPSFPTLDLYRDLLLDYAEGQSDEAIRKLLAWRTADIAAVARQIDPLQSVLRRAAALLHTDAAMRLRLSQPHATAAHFEIARALLARTEPESAFRRDFLLAVGYRLQVLPDAAAALRFFTECQEAFPRVATAWLASGTVYEFSAFPDGVGGTRIPGNVEELAHEAEKHYREALSIDPSLAEARLRLGRVLQRLGRQEEAIRELKRLAVERDKPVMAALAHLFLGDLFEQLGRLDQAAAQYRAAVETDPSLQQAGLSLSEILWRRGDRQLAVETLKRALQGGCSIGPSRWLDYHLGSGGQDLNAFEELRERIN
jgi:VWFA-related protein